VKRYRGGEPKLQIGPLQIKKEDGSIIFAKVRRWSFQDLLALRTVLDEALDLIDDQAAKCGGRSKAVR